MPHCIRHCAQQRYHRHIQRPSAYTASAENPHYCCTARLREWSPLGKYFQLCVSPMACSLKKGAQHGVATLCFNTIGAARRRKVRFSHRVAHRGQCRSQGPQQEVNIGVPCIGCRGHQQVLSTAIAREGSTVGSTSCSMQGASPVGSRGALREHFNRLLDAPQGFHMASSGKDLRGLGAEVKVGAILQQRAQKIQQVIDEESFARAPPPWAGNSRVLQQESH